jgi:hypothetical protein
MSKKGVARANGVWLYQDPLNISSYYKYNTELWRLDDLVCLYLLLGS